MVTLAAHRLNGFASGLAVPARTCETGKIADVTGVSLRGARDEDVGSSGMDGPRRGAQVDKRWQGARERRLEPGRRSLTASEAAAIIGVSVATIRGWADDGRLPSHRTVGGHRRFELEELLQWLEQRGAPAPRGVLPAALRVEVPRCPQLARELSVRVDSILARVESGYDEAVPTLVPPPPDGEMRRAATRFVRVVAGALET